LLHAPLRLQILKLSALLRVPHFLVVVVILLRLISALLLCGKCTTSLSGLRNQVCMASLTFGLLTLHEVRLENVWTKQLQLLYQGLMQQLLLLHSLPTVTLAVTVTVPVTVTATATVPVPVTATVTVTVKVTVTVTVTVMATATVTATVTTTITALVTELLLPRRLLLLLPTLTLSLTTTTVCAQPWLPQRSVKMIV
jgi:hypothetical protein